MLLTPLLSLVTDVWFVGDSYVSRAEERAVLLKKDRNLGLSCVQGIFWAGQGGMKWAQLKTTLQYKLLYNEPPRALVLHVGSNDLGMLKSIELRHAMKDDLLYILSMLQGSVLIVSAILPRLKWDRTSIPTNKIDKTRRQLNRHLRNLVEHDHGIFVSHEDITADTPGLYAHDGVHLSDVGCDLFLLGISTALEQVFME